MESKFASAFFLADWTVYGYALKPFCLLHSIRLEAIGSPLVCGGEVRPHDVLIAAQICATHENVTKFKRHRLRLIWQDPQAEYEKFAAYMSESRQLPDLQDDDGTSAGRGSLRAPRALIIVTSLIRHTMLTEKRALTMPEGLALYYFHSVMEQVTGRSDIYSEEEQREDAELLADAEANKERDAQRMADFMAYQKRREEGTWPKGLNFSFEMEWPPMPEPPTQEEA